MEREREREKGSMSQMERDTERDRERREDTTVHFPIKLPEQPQTAQLHPHDDDDE